MLQTFEGIIDPDGKLRLLDQVKFPKSRRVLITILDEEPEDEARYLALLSEPALAREWDLPRKMKHGHTWPSFHRCDPLSFL